MRPFLPSLLSHIIPKISPWLWTGCSWAKSTRTEGWCSIALPAWWRGKKNANWKLLSSHHCPPEATISSFPTNLPPTNPPPPPPPWDTLTESEFCPPAESQCWWRSRPSASTAWAGSKPKSGANALIFRPSCIFAGTEFSSRYQKVYCVPINWCSGLRKEYESGPIFCFALAVSIFVSTAAAWAGNFFSWEETFSRETKFFSLSTGSCCCRKYLTGLTLLAGNI